MKSESSGLKRVNEIYNDREAAARELKAHGDKIMGYMCIYPVIEMLTALDLVPYRIFGDIKEPITKADAALSTVVCPFLRSALDLGMKGRYDFLDGVVMAHACEVAEKLAHIWKIYLTPDYSYFIDTPHTTHKGAQDYHRELLKNFRTSLEKLTGEKLTDEKLIKAVKLHNEQRSLVRELYEYRKLEPPSITGSEVLKTIKALMSIPVKDGIELLKEVISEVKNRELKTSKEKVRLLLWGSIIDDAALIEMIEDAGADIVMDDTCVGSRAYFQDVEINDDPLGALAYRYLVELRCPRTFKASGKSTGKDYLGDITERFGYIGEFIKQWNARGVILHALRFCDIHAYEIPSLRDYLDNLGVRSIYIEPDYTESALAPLRTRIEAFIETLG